jgi:hypothetical protein
MKRIGLTLAAVAAAVLLSAPLVLTQSAYTTTYDVTRQVKIEGPVTRIDWNNPHAFLFVNVRDASGLTTNWAVEFGNPLDLERDGWKRNTLHIGDVVTVDGVPARSEKRQAFAKSVVQKTTGKRLFAPAVKRAAASSGGAAPRWPNGHVRLGPAPGKKGYWGAPSARVLVEASAAKLPMTDDGLLVNIADADRVAPFKPWAKAVYERRQRTLLKEDPMARCLPPGGPRQFLTNYGFQLVEQPDLGRILVLLGGGNRNWRMIYTDGRPQTTPAELVLTYYGSSVGKWDGDTLVVDSTGFNERFWMTSGGLPHTEALHLTERFSRPDLSTLKYDVTVDDPRTYTRPWTGGWTVKWVPDEDVQEYFCEDNAESTFVR